MLAGLGRFSLGGTSLLKALLVVRTPLQARIAEFAIEKEGNLRCDLLFFTQQRSPKNIRAFEVLGRHTERKFLIFVPMIFRWFSSEMLFWFFGTGVLKVWGTKYDTVILGSLDSPGLTAIARKTVSRLITIDDGSANIVSTSSYFVDTKSERVSLLRRLLSAPSPREIREITAKHYTIFPGKKNIVAASKLIPIRGWPPHRSRVPNANPLVVFISSPETRGMPGHILQKYERYLASLSIEYRISHPMDKGGLLSWVSELPHSELIAEDALAIVEPKRAIHLIGLMSTVMLTTGAIAESRTVVLWEKNRHLSDLAESAGCKVVLLK